MESLEDKLKRAMGPADAPEGFATRVMVRIRRNGKNPSSSHSGIFSVLNEWFRWLAGSQRTARPTWSTAVAGGLLCLLLFGLIVGRLSWEHRANMARQQLRGEQASAQLLLALKITGTSLSRVHVLLSEAGHEDGPAETRQPALR